jgi:hypothetical protein
LLTESGSRRDSSSTHRWLQLEYKETKKHKIRRIKFKKKLPSAIWQRSLLETFDVLTQKKKKEFILVLFLCLRRMPWSQTPTKN